MAFFVLGKFTVWKFSQLNRIRVHPQRLKGGKGKEGNGGPTLFEAEVETLV